MFRLKGRGKDGSLYIFFVSLLLCVFDFFCLFLLFFTVFVSFLRLFIGQLSVCSGLIKGKEGKDGVRMMKDF